MFIYFQTSLIVDDLCSGLYAVLILYSCFFIQIYSNNMLANMNDPIHWEKETKTYSFSQLVQLQPLICIGIRSSLPNLKCSALFEIKMQYKETNGPLIKQNGFYSDTLCFENARCSSSRGCMHIVTGTTDTSTPSSSH